MKKVTLKIVLLAFAGLTLVACDKNKCHECHYEKNDAEVELGEKCGKELETLEANGYNDNGNVYEVHCHEH